MMMEYLILIHVAEEGGYWAEFPTLPGCYTQGETLEELLEDAPKAIESHLEALVEFGKPIPHDRPFFTTIQAPIPSAV